MELAVAILAALVVIGLIVSLIMLGKKDFQGLALLMAKKERRRFEVLKPCPLCGTMLRRGETVKSKIVELIGSGKGTFGGAPGVVERQAKMYGCPHCWPANDTCKRICPACGRTLGQEDFVIGRYFERTSGKHHLHVLGCTKCRRS